MPTFIVTGNYTAKAIQGMIANPSDRAAAVKPLVEATGGQMLSYYATTGETDFLMICEAADGEDILPALMVAGATGTVSNLKTVRAYSSADFATAQQKAGGIAAKFKPAG
ncbi:MAG: GYD domain-containing protein [Ruegeria sp.]|uniref:GYD domain-containing protein n=1 Tax=Ruegeria sp. TaxID=1879320 RepID=UPI00349EAFE7